MSEFYVVFVDHPNVLPQQQDNPICFHHCRAQGCFCGEPCTYRDVSSLRQAVQQGYTKARTEAAYPPNWLDRTVRICHHGLVLLALEEPPVGHVAPEELPRKHAATEEGLVTYNTRSNAQPGNTPRHTAQSRTPHKHEVLDRALLGTCSRGFGVVVGARDEVHVASCDEEAHLTLSTREGDKWKRSTIDDGSGPIFAMAMDRFGHTHVRIEPKLGNAFTFDNMNMQWFERISFIGVEEKSVTFMPEYRWHLTSLPKIS